MVSILNRHLAELPSKTGGALTLVPGTAFATINTWQVTHHYSEVGRSQCVSSMAVLTDDSGCVPQLTVVVTSASYAG